MKKSKITLVVLVILTVLSAAVSNYGGKYADTIILLLAGLKFIGIAYFFMDLIKAHVFWRVIIGVYVFMLLAVILVLK